MSAFFAQERPITAAMNNLTGQFFADNSLISAVSMLVAVPTL